MWFSSGSTLWKSKPIKISKRLTKFFTYDVNTNNATKWSKVRVYELRGTNCFITFAWYFLKFFARIIRSQGSIWRFPSFSTQVLYWPYHDRLSRLQAYTLSLEKNELYRCRHQGNRLSLKHLLHPIKTLSKQSNNQ